MADSDTQEQSEPRGPGFDVAARNAFAGDLVSWALPSKPQTDAQAATAPRGFDVARPGRAAGSSFDDLIAPITDEELANFRLACAEAARAELELINPLIGLQHYRAALHHFPFLPGLDVLRDKLIASARHEVDVSLHSVDACLKDQRTWRAAGRALAQVRALIEVENTLRSEYGARYALLKSIYRRVIQLTPARRHGGDCSDEHALLRDLRDELADDPESYWHQAGWRGVRARLDQLDRAAQDERRHALRTAHRQWLAEAQLAYNDTSASTFIERYVQAGNSPPRDEDVARLQLEEAGALIARADELLSAHWADAPAALHGALDELEGWQRDLRALIAGLNLASHRAELGLREPAQFDVARYVLGSGGRQPATAFHPVPHMFVGHPTLLRCKAFVESCAARRKGQERLREQIALCLRFDAVTAPEDITAPETDVLRRMLREHSQAHMAHPIEVAWHKAREMARAEPDDACGLQRDMVYTDSDDDGREVVSLPAISAVLHRKVRQVRILRDWLTGCTADGHRADLDFPGVVNWEREKAAIETLRDSGPAELAEAQARCRSAKSGEGEGVTEGLWSLERMCQAMSRDGMLTHLCQRDPEAASLPLCAPARAIDQQRHELWISHVQRLRECDQLAADIASRIERFAPAWDEFERRYRALMAMSSLRRRRIAESAEWRSFQGAAERFCAICPNYAVFQSKLSDIQARFGLQPACLDGRLA